MELDNTPQDQSGWNPTPFKNVAVVAIVFNSLFVFLMTIFLIFSGELYNVPEKDLPPLPEGMTLEDFVQTLVVFCALGILMLVGNTIGAVLMMRKNSAGWVLFLVTNILTCLVFVMSLVSGDIVGTVIFFIYLTLTILANKHRYKEEKNFENYTN